MSSKATATYDGFVGHYGQAVRIVAGQDYPVSHEVVQKNPHLFQIINDGSRLVGPDGDETADQRVARLRRELEAAQELAAADAAAEEQKAKDQELPPYSEWTLRDLQAECRTRELNAAGTKADLAARLEAWDLDHPDE